MNDKEIMNQLSDSSEVVRQAIQLARQDERQNLEAEIGKHKAAHGVMEGHYKKENADLLERLKASVLESARQEHLAADFRRENAGLKAKCDDVFYRLGEAVREKNKLKARWEKLENQKIVSFPCVIRHIEPDDDSPCLTNIILQMMPSELPKEIWSIGRETIRIVISKELESIGNDVKRDPPSVRDKLLTMGKFNDVPIDEEEPKPDSGKRRVS